MILYQEDLYMTDEKITECIKLMEQTHQYQNNFKENKRKLEKNKAFFENYLIFEEILIKLSLIKKYNFDFKLSLETSKLLKILLKNIKLAFDNKLVSNSISYKLDIDTLNRKISIEWKDYIIEYVSNTIENLEILNLVSNKKTTIKRIISILENFSNWDKLSYESIENFIKNYKLAQEELKNMNFTYEISNFLKKVKNKQATANDLLNNNDVLSWIKEENLLDKLILTIRLF